MNESILVVDDIPANVKLCRIVLERAGYRVTGATSGEEAVRLVRAAPPGLILMDLRLPGGITGYETTAAVRALPSGGGILILAITASTSAMDDALRAAGFDGLLLKPIDIAALPRQVAEAFRNGRNGRG